MQEIALVKRYRINPCRAEKPVEGVQKRSSFRIRKSREATGGYAKAASCSGVFSAP